MIRAKFKCETSVATDGNQHQVTLRAVTDGSDENKSFSRWTSSGQIALTISDETPAATFLEPGEEYYIDFTKSEVCREAS